MICLPDDNDVKKKQHKNKQIKLAFRLRIRNLVRVVKVKFVGCEASSILGEMLASCSFSE